MNYPPFPYDKLQEMASFDEEYVQELKKLYIKFFNEFPQQYKECTVLNISKEKLALLDHKCKPSIIYLGLEILAKEIKKGRDLVENSPEKTEEILKTSDEITQICNFYYKILTQ